MDGLKRECYVDIVMCIDATGSMSPIIDEVKRNALSFYQKFIDAMEENGKAVAQLRIKVIAFRDYGIDEIPMMESAFFKLPDENVQFEAFVNRIEAKGGGDEPENAFEAIALALKSDWTMGGDMRRHVILVFSDAPALALGERASSSQYPSGMPADLAQLQKWWEGTDQTFSSTYQKKAGRMVAFVPNVEPWGKLESWSRYLAIYSAAGTGLADLDIEGDIILSVSCAV